MFGKPLLLLAILLLSHATYAVYSHFSHSNVLGKPENPIPLNIVYESIFALVIGTLGASLNAPPLKDITWAGEMKKRTIDGMDARTSLANYISRGKLFQVAAAHHKK